MKKILEESIFILNLDKITSKRLSNNNIDTIIKLCEYSRIDLTKLEFTNEQINKIIVNLQLIGLDLKRNHAKRNTILDNMI